MASSCLSINNASEESLRCCISRLHLEYYDDTVVAQWLPMALTRVSRRDMAFCCPRWCKACQTEYAHSQHSPLHTFCSVTCKTGSSEREHDNHHLTALLFHIDDGLTLHFDFPAASTPLPHVADADALSASLPLPSLGHSAPSPCNAMGNIAKVVSLIRPSSDATPTEEWKLALTGQAWNGTQMRGYDPIRRLGSSSCMGLCELHRC